MDKIKYEQLSKRIQKEELLIYIGGPLQTMLTGLIGLGLLRWRRNQIQEGALSLVDWIFVFLALFWLREVFNLSTHILFGFINDTGYYFGGDEAFISSSLKLWPGTIPIILGLVGACISMYVVFWIIPLKVRPTFILGGLAGGVLGYVLWMIILGPMILP